MLKKGMDSLFKQKLLNLRKPPVPTTFGAALLGDISWLRPSETPVEAAVPSPVEYSEKVHVIESLERYAQEKSQELQRPVLKLDGGELHIRPDPGWDDLTHFAEQESLFQNLKLDKNLLAISLKDNRPEEIKVLFVSEKFRPWEEVSPELREGFINELLVGFPTKTAELFERMILAMKLTAAEVIIYPVEGASEEDYSRDVMEVAAYYHPEIIITLGAKATHKILKSNDRLSLVHGQFFNRKMGERASFQVVPLFHPSIIETNQNMKKTAWTDMQKIMKQLKKLP